MDGSSEQRNKPKNFSLEPATFLVILAWSLQGITLTNQLMYQSCVNVFGYNETECTTLTAKNGSMHTKDMEDEIQPYVANIQLASTIIQILLSTVACLILGPWSDHNGRKPVLTALFLGTSLNLTLVLIFAVLSTYYTINPWIYVIATVPYALCGGSAVLIATTFSYISDITLPENRSIRGGIFQAVFLLSTIIGVNLCGYLIKHVGNVWIFALSCVCGWLGLLLICLFLQETIEKTDTDRGLMLIWKLFKEIYETATRERNEGSRGIVWLCVLALCCYSFTFNGPEGIVYLYTREQFNWSAQDFTSFISFSMIVAAIGGFMSLVVLRKLLNASDALISVLAFANSVGASVILAFAQSSWQAYLASSFGFIRAIAFTTCRTILANVGPDEDLGKINALLAVFESMFNLFAAPLYTALYTRTIRTFPGAYNLLSAGVLSLACILLVIVYLKQRATRLAPRYSTL